MCAKFTTNFQKGIPPELDKLKAISNSSHIEMHRVKHLNYFEDTLVLYWVLH